MGVQRLVSAKAGLGYNNIRAGIAKGGVMELQRELAALVPYPEKKYISKCIHHVNLHGAFTFKTLYACLEYTPAPSQTLALSVHCT